MVTLLDPHAGGEDAGQQVGTLGRAEFTANDGQPGFASTQFVAHGGQVARQCRVDDAGILQTCASRCEQPGEVGARPHVVGALHGENVGGGGIRSQAVAQPHQPLDEAILVGRQPGSVAVGIAQMEQEHLAAIGTAPV